MTQIKDAAGNRTTSSVMLLTSHTGYSRVVITTPIATVGNRIPTDLGIAPGNIIDYGNIVGVGTVNVNDDATFDADEGVEKFTAYVGNLVDGWGNAEVQSIDDELVGVINCFIANKLTASKFEKRVLRAGGF